MKKFANYNREEPDGTDFNFIEQHDYENDKSVTLRNELNSLDKSEKPCFVIYSPKTAEKVEVLNVRKNPSALRLSTEKIQIRPNSDLTTPPKSVRSAASIDRRYRKSSLSKTPIKQIQSYIPFSSRKKLKSPTGSFVSRKEHTINLDLEYNNDDYIYLKLKGDTLRDTLQPISSIKEDYENIRDNLQKDLNTNDSDNNTG